MSLYKKPPLDRKNLDLLSAGTMIPACIFVSWLIYKWMLINQWVGEKVLVWFILFGIVTGFYNFFRMVGVLRGRTSNETSTEIPSPRRDEKSNGSSEPPPANPTKPSNPT